jgi:hypothetical protein
MGPFQYRISCNAGDCSFRPLTGRPLHQSSMPIAVVHRNSDDGRLHEVRSVAGKQVRNTILLQLPEAEFRRIKPQLEAVRFQIADLLERQTLPVNGVYFLNTGIASHPKN